MLPDDVKETIQAAYRQILEKKSLRPRYGQRLMIAELAKCLGEIDPDGGNEEADNPPPICVVEAGTGTGKTLAYVLAVLPVAKYLGKKVVIATATVALQEQVILKDLPDIKANTDLDFTFSLAKGRGRYLCLSKLDLLLQENDSQNAMLDLYGDTVDADNSYDHALYEKMLKAIASGKWRGDRDEWETPLNNSEWTPVTVANGQCVGSKCSNFSNCCFYKAREQVQKSDCVVANHDLVLADLALGGGVILPDPGNTIYIFDEAHHLPIKSNSHFSAYTRVKGSINWLQQASRSLARLATDPLMDSQRYAATQGDDLNRAIEEVSEKLLEAYNLLEQIFNSTQRDDWSGSSDQHTFKLGVVPDELMQLAEQLTLQFHRLEGKFQHIADELKSDIDGTQSMKARQRAEHWFPVVGSLCSRAQTNLNLWDSFSRPDPPGIAPQARWLTLVDNSAEGDISLSSSPVIAATNLTDKLWERCCAAVLTSATLSALGNFDVLNMRTGLPAHSKYFRIPSPFDYKNAATFVVPRLSCEPGNSVLHTEAIIEALPKVLDKKEAALMLFSSRRQMQDVLNGLDGEWRDIILCQDDYQKSQLLRFHKQRIDRGEGSIIFGLSSFAEGVDLPGDYCRHVLIAKIPFAVPNDPIESTLASWVEQQGKNPFMVLAVPEAAFRLVQASGRLLRSETDTGRITLFDNRIVSKFYGKKILDSLPPYRMEIF